MESSTVSREFHEHEVKALKYKIEEAYGATERAVYQRQVAEWALTGVVTSQAKVVFTQSILAAHEISELAENISKRVACEVMHLARLAFNEHADMYALRKHVRYMENHASRGGTQFSPLNEREHLAIPAIWDRPKPFASPFQHG